jgi:hypothetical protein
MYGPRPLSDYPAATLDILRGTVAGLLRYQDMLPTDLYVKLHLFRDDISQAIRPRAQPELPHGNPSPRKAPR